MHRMFGSRNIPKIAKYAIVIYKFTQESKYDVKSITAKNRAKALTRRMMKKLHSRLLKDQKYDIHTTSFGKDEKYSDWIGTLANERRYYMEGFGIYLLECNQAVHPIIHHYAQDYDPNDKESKKCDFFTEIFEELKKD